MLLDLVFCQIHILNWYFSYTWMPWNHSYAAYFASSWTDLISQIQASDLKSNRIFDSRFSSNLKICFCHHLGLVENMSFAYMRFRVIMKISSLKSILLHQVIIFFTQKTSMSPSVHSLICCINSTPYHIRWPNAPTALKQACNTFHPVGPCRLWTTLFSLVWNLSSYLFTIAYHLLCWNMRKCYFPCLWFGSDLFIDF